MAPLLHWGTKEIIKGLHFWDPLQGLGCHDVQHPFETVPWNPETLISAAQILNAYSNILEYTNIVRLCSMHPRARILKPTTAKIDSGPLLLLPLVLLLL